MLFLFNDVVFNIGPPQQRLAASKCPVPTGAIASLTNGEMLSLLREAAFTDPNFARSQTEKAMALAAMTFLKTGANAVLALRPPACPSAANVPVRLADVSLRVLGDLFALDQMGKLTPQAIDGAVWRAAAA